MPVAEMRQRLTYDEYLRWGVYFGKKAQAMELERAKQNA